MRRVAEFSSYENFLKKIALLKQLDLSHRRRIPLAHPGTDDARVASVAASEAGSDHIEELLNDVVRRQVGCNQTTAVQVALFCPRDHASSSTGDLFGPGYRRLDGSVRKQRRCQVAQHRATVVVVAP